VVVAINTWHVVGLAVSLVLVVYLTIRFAHGIKSADGFSVHGRKFGTTMIAGGIVGTGIGGASTIGTAQGGFSHGITALWFTLGTGIALILMGLFYAKTLRASRLVTLPQFLASHYGRSAGPLIGIISSMGILLSSIATMISGIAVIGLLAPLPPWGSALLIVGIAVASVFFGGIKSVGVSGLIKVVVIFVSLTLAGVAAVSMLAGLDDFQAMFPAADWFNPFRGGIGRNVGDLSSLVVGVLCTQTHIQALYSAVDTRRAVRGALVAGLITILIGPLGVAIGMAMRAAHPDIAPILALPMFLMLHLPPLIGGVALAGLLLSVVGAVAGLSLGIGTMLANDIGCDVFGVRDGIRLLRLNRAMVVCAAGLAGLVAVETTNYDVLRWSYLAMALRGCGVFLPMTLAIFAPGRLASGWAIASMAGGGLAATAAGAFPDAVNPMIAGMGVNLAIVAVGLVFGAKAVPRDCSTPFGRLR